MEGQKNQTLSSTAENCSEKLASISTFLNTNGLFGRESEKSKINSAVQRISSGERVKGEVILLYGPSGVGKTDLVQSVRKDCVANGSSSVLWASARHEQQFQFDAPKSLQKKRDSAVNGGSKGKGSPGARPQGPLSALSDALTQIFQRIEEKGDSTFASARQSLNKYCSLEEINLLATLIPSIRAATGRELEASEGRVVEPLPSMPQSSGATSENKGLKHPEDLDLGIHQNDNDNKKKGNKAPTVNNPYTLRRMIILIARVFKLVASEETPVVLFLDDLQWADRDSQAALSTLLKDSCLFNLLLIGAVQTDQEGDDTNSTGSNGRDDFSAQSTVAPFSLGTTKFPVENLILGPFTEHQCNELISQALRLPTADTMELGRLVYHRTAGNPYFVIQFLGLLDRKGWIKFDTDRKQFSFDLGIISAETSLMGNVVAVMAQKISQLPHSDQVSLVVASILGYTFNADLLECALNSIELVSLFPTNLSISENAGELDSVAGSEKTRSTTADRDYLATPDARSSLAVLCEAGMIEQVGEKSSRTYRFTHQQVQETAAAMLPSCENGPLIKGSVGALILDVFHLENDKEDCLRLATSLVAQNPSPLPYDQVARLCIDEAQKAANNADFRSSAKYAEAGIQRLERTPNVDCWEVHYSMLLELNSLSAEMHFAHGNMEKSKMRVEEVKAHAKRPRDTLRSFRVLLDMHGAKEEWGQAIVEIRHALKYLGFKTPPKHANSIHVVRDLIKSKMMLKGRTPKELEEQLPDVTDPIIDESMYYYGVIGLYAYFDGDQDLCASACNMLFQSILTHGINKNAANGMGAYGSICAILGDTNTAYQFGELALKLLDRPNLYEKQQQDQQVARVSSIVYGLLTPLKEPLRVSLIGLQDGFDAGIRAGEIVQACNCIRTRGEMGLYVGMSLPDFMREVQGYRLFMLDYKQLATVTMIRGYLQCAENLTGKNTLHCSPNQLRGTFMDEEEEEKVRGGRNATTEDHLVLLTYHYARMLLLYLLGQHEAAEADRSKFANKFKYEGAPLWGKAFTYCISGLNCYALARRFTGALPRKRMISLGNSYRQKLQPWTKCDSPMVSHMIKLMDAEELSTKTNGKATMNQDSEISKLFRGAIQEAEDGCHFLTKAIGCELLAEHMLEGQGPSFPGTIEAIRDAFQAYTDYGAILKLHHMEVRYRKVVALGAVPTSERFHQLRVEPHLLHQEPSSSLLDE